MAGAGYWADIYNMSSDFAWNLVGFQRHHDERIENQEREDNAVRRRMKDLTAAGINPLLAGGSPAQSTPTTANSFLSSGGSKQNYAQLALVKSQIDKNKADTNASKASEVKLLSDANLSDTMQGKVQAEQELIKGQSSMIEVEKDYRWQQKKLIDSNLMLNQSQLATDSITRQKLHKEIGKINEEWNNLCLDFQRKGVELDRMYKVDDFIKKYPKLGTLYLLLGPTGSGMAIHGVTKSGSEIIGKLLEMVPADLLKKKNPIGFGPRK